MTRALSTHEVDKKFIHKCRKGSLGYRLENNIKMYLTETEYGVEQVHLTQI
jgi:hypothetical protein